MELYHVYNRGNHKGNICFDNMDLNVLKKMFFDSLSSLYGKESSVVSLCIMPNHYHLLVDVAKKEFLSMAMRDIGREYTAYMNRKYGLAGRLFQGPYNKKLVGDFIYFRTLVQYMRDYPKEMKYYKHLTTLVENEQLIEYYDFLLSTKNLL